MTTRADVTRLSLAMRELVRQAQGDIASFFYSWGINDPARMRDALLEIVPSLVNEYGDIAAVAAAEWYEELRGRAVSGGYSAVLADSVPDAAVQGSVRWAAGELFGENPTGALELLNGAVQRHITYMGRETVRRNVGQDRSRPRFARVPTGVTTCPFCEMLASRGFVYHSEASAGALGAASESFHDSCDCQVVPEWDADRAHIEGYDPDAMYDRYEQAREAWMAQNPGRSPQAGDLAPVLRDLFPDQYTPN